MAKLIQYCKVNNNNNNKNEWWKGREIEERINENISDVIKCPQLFALWSEVAVSMI